MMFSQGAVLALHTGAGLSASMHALTWVCGGEFWASALLMITFPCVILSARWKWLLMPQLTISSVYAAGALTAILTGSYADNYVPAGGRAFIYNDQIAYITLLVIHAFVVRY